MNKGRFTLTVALAAAFLAATPAHSQVLQVFVTVNGITSNVGAGGSVSLTAPGVSQAVFASVVVRYVGTATATITSLSLSGTSEMTLLQTSTPITLSPNGTTSFTVEYLSAAGVATTGQVAIAYTENTVASTFPFFLNGTAPRLSFSYIPSGGASTTLNAGGQITFPATSVGTSVTAVVNVSNSGSGIASLQSIGATGTGFQVTNSPAPIQLSTSQQTSFNVVFTPPASGSVQGSLVLGFSNTTVSFSLAGTGAAPNFTVTYTLADGNAHTIANGAAINFPSVDLNGTTIATIDIINQGTGSGTVTGASVAGTGFRTGSLAALPATVGPNQDFRFQIIFNPTQAGSYNGTFNFSMTGLAISGTLAAATSSPTFSLAYVDPNTNNVLALQDGATLPFPNTPVNTVANITLRVTNNGAGTGFLNSLTLGGTSPAVFQILNQPSLPAPVPPSQQLNFGVRFSPLLQQQYSATLVLNLNGQTLTINLAAQGIGPQYTYTWSNSAATTPVSPGGTIALGNTNVGQTSTITILITNTGAGDGQISPITVTGQGLSFSNPPAVPVTLHSKASLSLTLNFAPAQPGAVSGTLTIGTDTFTVTATGIGSLLNYTYTNSASTISVATGGIVIFQPTAVESTASVTFSIQNTGTSSTTISSINLGAASPVFSLPQLALPTNIAPGSTITFSINFVPNGLGTLTATLFVNSTSFTLSGTGTQPAALPAYQFQGPSGTQAAAQQPSIGLTLSAGYPLPLQGTLTLTFSSAVFTDDPSIQFASGGRTAKFTIPANSTQAVFTGGATMMPLQTGTTAGTIVITPSFSTQNGFDLTPASPASVTMTIAKSAPQLSNQSVTSETLSGFTVVLSGYSTTRALTQLSVQINPKPGATFSATTLTINVTSTASAWYQSTTSQTFGGEFLAEIPFVLSNGSTTADLVHQVQSLTITATNDIGTSSSISVPIP